MAELGLKLQPSNLEPCCSVEMHSSTLSGHLPFPTVSWFLGKKWKPHLVFSSGDTQVWAQSSNHRDGIHVSGAVLLGHFSLDSLFHKSVRPAAERMESEAEKRPTVWEMSRNKQCCVFGKHPGLLKFDEGEFWGKESSLSLERTPKDSGPQSVQCRWPFLT